MSQISQPVRILLIGAVVFLAAWFTLLRPKSETVPPPTTSTTTTTPVATATPQTGLGKAVDAAKKAAGAKTEATATATPGDRHRDHLRARRQARDRRRSRRSRPRRSPSFPKDRRRRAEGRARCSCSACSPRTPSRGARWPTTTATSATRSSAPTATTASVVVKTVGLDKLSTYGALVNDLGVTQSPSIVVIDRNLKGTVLTGYVDRVAINQAIADARRDSITPNITDTYLRQANALCGALRDVALERWSLPTIAGRKAAVASLQALRARSSAATGRQITALDAPAKCKRLKRTRG